MGSSVRWPLVAARSVLVGLWAGSACASTALRLAVAEALPVAGYKTAGTNLNGGVATAVTSTATGPTSGIQVTATAGGTALKWISPPLAAAVTISGTVTFSGWAKESSTAANAGLQVSVHRYTTAEQSAFLNSEHGTELGTAVAQRTWTATPTSTNFVRGDRIVIKWLVNDAGGTLASGSTVTLDYNGATASADGDTSVTFTENLAFQTADAAFIEEKDAEVGGVSSTTQTFAYASRTGDTMLVTLTWAPQNINVSSVTDSNSNTYTSAIGPVNWAGASGYRSQIWYAKNINGGATPATITVAMTGSASVLSFFQHEYAGINTSVPIIGTSQTVYTTTAATFDSGSVATPVTDAVVFGYCVPVGVAATGSGMTQRVLNNGNVSEDRYVTTSGSYSATATSSAADAIMQAVVLRAARQRRRVILVE